jgi:hypothetical protein
MSNTHQPITQLETSFKRLRQRWEEGKQLWDDPVQQDFERRYWEPMGQETMVTLREMTRLAETLARAQRHVEKP